MQSCSQITPAKNERKWLDTEARHFIGYRISVLVGLNRHVLQHHCRSGLTSAIQLTEIVSNREGPAC